MIFHTKDAVLVTKNASSTRMKTTTTTTMTTTNVATRVAQPRSTSVKRRVMRAASSSSSLSSSSSVSSSVLSSQSGLRRRVDDVVLKAIQEPEPETSASSSSSSSSSSSTSIRDIKWKMKDMRKQMAENEDLDVLMSGLRGTNIDQSDFAEQGVEMKVIDFDKYDEGTNEDKLPLVYDPEAIERYWSKRSGAVVQRALQLVSIGGGFISGLIADFITKKTEENSVERAIQLREIVTSLGPAYIKLGQALAIRPDLLGPQAMVELQKLCDKVPSFDNELAFQTLENELGCKWQDVYSELGPEPVAAASLGQVYKGVLKSNGATVAVKVQRPAVLETVSIDLFVLRRVGLFLRTVEGFNTDVVALLDEWALRFFEELDYVNEGKNQIKFAKSIKKDLPQVVVPGTYMEYTRRKVITSEWLEGEKLSQSTADDVGDLVKVGVICYLKQLLDTGFFHADPHPGNLIRTPDGRLAILDFGLMTQIDENIKYGMIEAISHLIHRDYDAIVNDFVTLDFIAEGTDLSPLSAPLGRVFDQALEGGGAKSINFQELASDLAQITFDFPFRIPPYFAIIIRAIGVLEGIALVGDPDFALVDEAYPYLSKRLLTSNDDERLQEALRYMVYGKSTVFDADRLIDLLEALESFKRDVTTSSGVTAEASINLEKKTSREALQFVLSPQGSFFREFLLDEVVKGVDALSRESAVAVLTSVGLKDAKIPILFPILGLPNSIALAPKVTQEDKETAENVTKLLNFLLGRNESGSTSNENAFSRETFEEMRPFLPAVANQILPTLVERLSSRLAARAVREIFV